MIAETTTQPATGTLLSMRKTNATYRVDEALLRGVKPPEATKTWMPVAHSEMLDYVLQACEERGLVIEKRELSLSNNRQQFFGVLVMRAAAGRDFTVAMGIRNSTDKSMPAGIASGAKVLICDNLSLSGDITFFRKHTPRIHLDLPVLVRAALDRFIVQVNEQATVFDAWKRHQIDLPKATNLIVQAAEQHLIPQVGILKVRSEFIKPRHQEFQGDTVWTLYNAFTQYLTHDREEVAPIKSQRDFINMHQLLATTFPVSN
jgi:hypothetical protein